MDKFMKNSGWKLTHPLQLITSLQLKILPLFSLKQFINLFHQYITIFLRNL